MASSATTDAVSPPTDQPMAGQQDEAGPSVDLVYELLSNQRRRRTIRYLLDAAGSDTATLSDLAEHVAGLENDKPPRRLSSDERKRVYISLYQCHLPKLDDAGVIDFDGDRKTVVLGETADAVARFLPERVDRQSPDEGDGWTGPLASVADWLAVGF